MRTQARVPAMGVLFVLLVTVAGSCSKSVAPIARDASGALRGAGGGGGDPAAAPIPSPYIVRLKFIGPVVTLDAAYQPVLDRNAEFFVYSTGVPPAPGAAIDTVPAGSELKQVSWRSAKGGAQALSAAGEPEVLEEPPVIVDAAAHGGAQTFPPGYNQLTLQAPARAGGGMVTVAFVVNFPPGAWWAGPDPALFPPASDGDGRAVDVTDWSRFTTTPAWPPDGRGYFGPDSFRFVPSQRLPVRGDLERRTFYEIFGDRIYARTEGDTVHQDSWVVFAHAGFDRDSRYAPRVDPTDPGLPAGFASRPDLYAVLIPQGLLGSPSAFRSAVTFKLDDGSVVRPSVSPAYPDFDPLSVFRNPHVAGYARMFLPGKAYALVQPVDADGGAGRLGDSEVAIADRVDAGGGTPADRLARRQILTFFVRGDAGAGPAQAATATKRRSTRGS